MSTAGRKNREEHRYSCHFTWTYAGKIFFFFKNCSVEHWAGDSAARSGLSMPLKKHLPFALMTPTGITSVMGHASPISMPRNESNKEFERISVFELVILFRDANL